MTDGDAPKAQPLIDDYAKANNVTIEVQQNPYAALQQKLTLSLTQGTGDYDVVCCGHSHERPLRASVDPSRCEFCNP